MLINIVIAYESCIMVQVCEEESVGKHEDGRQLLSEICREEAVRICKPTLLPTKSTS